MRSMQREGLKCNGSLDVFVKMYESNEKLETELRNVCTNEKIKYKHWKKALDNSNSQLHKYRLKDGSRRDCEFIHFFNGINFHLYHVPSPIPHRKIPITHTIPIAYYLTCIRYLHFQIKISYL